MLAKLKGAMVGGSEAQEIKNEEDEKEEEMWNKENRLKKKENAYGSTVKLKESLPEEKKIRRSNDFRGTVP